MGLRQKEWARKARQELLAQLGGCCAQCGTTDNLEFDCIKPCGDAHHRYEYSQRISFYRAQARARNLQVLCKEHNRDKANADRKYWANRYTLERAIGLAYLKRKLQPTT